MLEQPGNRHSPGIEVSKKTDYKPRGAAADERKSLPEKEPAKSEERARQIWETLHDPWDLATPEALTFPLCSITNSLLFNPFVLDFHHLQTKES